MELFSAHYVTIGSVAEVKWLFTSVNQISGFLKLLRIVQLCEEYMTFVMVERRRVCVKVSLAIKKR